MPDVGGIDGIVAQDGGCEFWIIHIARHQRVTLTGNQSFVGNHDTRMRHGTT